MLFSSVVTRWSCIAATELNVLDSFSVCAWHMLIRDMGWLVKQKVKYTFQSLSLTWGESHTKGKSCWSLPEMETPLKIGNLNYFSKQQEKVVLLCHSLPYSKPIFKDVFLMSFWPYVFQKHQMTKGYHTIASIRHTVVYTSGLIRDSCALTVYRFLPSGIW